VGGGNVRERLLQHSFLVIGSFLSGCFLIALDAGTITVQGVSVTAPLFSAWVCGEKALLLFAGAVCLGVQTHCYKAQKRLMRLWLGSWNEWYEEDEESPGFPVVPGILFWHSYLLVVEC